MFLQLHLATQCFFTTPSIFIYFLKREFSIKTPSQQAMSVDRSKEDSWNEILSVLTRVFKS